MIFFSGLWRVKSRIIAVVTFLLSGCVHSSPQSIINDLSTVEYGPDVRTLTVEGAIDPRLYAIVVTTYRPADYDKSSKGCTRYDWNTAARKGVLDWEFVEIKPDEDNHYKVTLPIDYIGEKKCGYEFVSTEIKIQRDRKDGQFATITLLSDSQRNYDIVSSEGGRLPDYAIKKRKAMKDNYRLSEGSYIQCHTDYYDPYKGVPAAVVFNCYPVGGGDGHGVTTITSIVMSVDILINEDVGRYYYGTSTNVKTKKDKFRDYGPSGP